MDIEGAFSHATFKSMDEAIATFNIDHVCHRWVKNMLMNRIAITESPRYASKQKCRAGLPTRRSPVAAPVDLVVHELLFKLQTEFSANSITQGYADDIANLATGYT